MKPGVVVLLLFLIINTPIYSQNIDWAIGLQTSATANSQVFDLATDTNGNIFAAGRFAGTMDFDPGPGVANKTAIGTPAGDGYLAKYDSAGNYQWVIHFESSDNEIESVVTDSLGNVYVVGDVKWGTLDLDPGAGTSLITAGPNVGFIAKYDPNGNYVWSFPLAQKNGTRSVQIWGLAIHHSELVMTGYITDSVDFDPGVGEAYITTEMASGFTPQNAFIAKYDLNGNYILAFQIEGRGSDFGHAVVTDQDGNIFMRGYFSDTLDFDPGPANSMHIVPVGKDEMFIAKYNASGDYQWAINLGMDKLHSTYEGNTLVTDNFGSIYVTGFVNDTNDFNPDPNAQALVPADDDFFIAKYNAQGEYEWAFAPSGPSYGTAEAIGIDSCQNIYVTGMLRDTIDFDPGPGIANMYANRGMFLAKYSSNGNYLWSTTNDDDVSTWMSLTALNVNRWNEIYIGGIYRNNAPDFDTGTAVVTVPNGVGDMFIAKYQPTVNLLSADLPVVTVSNSNSCSGDTTILQVNGGALNGATDWFWYEKGCGDDLIGTGTAFPALPTTSTTYYVRGEGTCVSPGICDSLTVSVIDRGEASISFNIAAIDTICADADDISPTVTGGAGGTFSINNGGIIDASTGTVDVMSSGAGTFDIIYTATGNCPGIDTATINIRSVDTVKITAVDTLCENEADLALTANYIGGNWSGIGIVDAVNGTFSATTSGTGTFEVIYTSLGLCPGADTASITVTPNDNVNISPLAPLCDTENDTALSVNSTKGYWSGIGIVDTVNGIFSPTTSGAGTYDVVYTSFGNCPGSDSIDISVISFTPVSIQLEDTLCDNDDDITLSANISGGYWSGTGIIDTANGVFSPVISGEGDWLIKYARGSSNCLAVDSITINVETININMESSVSINKGDSVYLNASGGSSYQWTPTTALSCSDCPDPIAFPDVTTNFCVEVTSTAGCMNTACIDVLVVIPEEPCGSVFIPTAFSPNGDNANDELCLYNANCLDNFRLLIYDRWGKLLLETTDSSFCWDGTFNGKKINTTVLAYYFTANTSGGTVIEKYGNISLIR